MTHSQHLFVFTSTIIIKHSILIKNHFLFITCSIFFCLHSCDVKINFLFITRSIFLICLHSCDALYEDQNETLPKRFQSWLLDSYSLKHRILQLNPFRTSCLGLHIKPKSENVNVSVELKCELRSVKI